MDTEVVFRPYLFAHTSAANTANAFEIRMWPTPHTRYTCFNFLWDRPRNVDTLH